MPPWKPEPGFGEFQGARRLTEAEISAFKTWVEEGAAEGEPEDLPPTPVFADDWHLGVPDLALKMENAYSVPADSPEFYWCFVIPTGLQVDKYFVAYEIQPTSRKVVHHSILVQDIHGAARRMESESGSGYPCMGGFWISDIRILGILDGGHHPQPRSGWRGHAFEERLRFGPPGPLSAYG